MQLGRDTSWDWEGQQQEWEGVGRGRVKVPACACHGNLNGCIVETTVRYFPHTPGAPPPRSKEQGSWWWVYHVLSLAQQKGKGKVGGTNFEAREHAQNKAAVCGPSLPSLLESCV